MKRVIFFLFVFVFISGCGTQPNTKSHYNIKGNKSVNGKSGVAGTGGYKYVLYGKLEKKGTGYSFTEFAENHVKNQPWVRLADMRPMWNTEKEDCLAGLANSRKVVCKTENKRLFRVKGLDFSLKKTAGYVLSSAMTFGLGATMPPASVDFDRDLFLSAIEDAKKRAGLTTGSINLYLKKYDKEMESFDRSYKELVSSYSVSSTPKINLHDKSGIFAYSASVFEENVRLGKNWLPTMRGSKIVKAKTIDNMLLLVKNRNLTISRNLREAVSTLSVTCTNRALPSVDYKMTCPKKVDSSKSTFGVDVVVNSISFNKVLPKYIKEEDKNITLIFKDGFFYLSNKTKSYITVDSISFYYSGKISTISKISNEFAPLSEGKLVSIDRFSLSENVISFKNVKKRYAHKKNIEYGVAIKYRISGANKERTLFKTRKYRLSNLI